MSMGSNVGASVAAKEIITLVEKLIEEHPNEENVVKVLNIVLDKAKDIESSADSGWY